MSDARWPNSLRGESKFEINGTAHLLRPSFENLVAAEEEVGSLFALVDRAAEGGLTLSEMCALIWHCIEAEQKPKREAVGEAIIEAGMVESTIPIRVVLSQVLKGQNG